MLENIKSSNLQRCEEINEKVKAIKDNIVKMELELKEYFKEIKEMSVKGYFYLYETSYPLDHPIKCSIKDVECWNGWKKGIIYVIAETKKRYNNEHCYSLNEFLNLNLYRKEEEAYKDYNDFITNRNNKIKEFVKKGTLFYGEDGYVYEMKYDDEYVRERGFGGRTFTFQRLDTNEIITTSNLWSSNTWGYKDFETFPRIRFIGEKPH